MKRGTRRWSLLISVLLVLQLVGWPARMQADSDAGPPMLSGQEPRAVLENDAYRVTEQDDFRLIVEEKSTGASAVFVPRLSVVYSTNSPQKGTGKITGATMGTGTTQLNFTVLAWNGNPDFSAAPGTRADHPVVDSVYADNRLTWSFTAGDGYTVSAELVLPAGSGEPKLTYSLDPEVPRYYSVAFTGAPSSSAGEADWIYQPGVWHGKRIPDKSYMTDESRAGLPVVMFGKNGTAAGQYADPGESPFRLPTLANSRYGLSLRDAFGRLSPAIYAPLYGSPESWLTEPYSFSVRLLARSGDRYDTFRHLAEEAFAFGDYRENSLTTLNGTLDHLTDYIMNEGTPNYSYWDENHKTNEYINDKPGYGRQQSAVDALSLAMVRDSRELFEERALPTIEYYASRKNLMIKLNGYDPDYPMGGPVVNPSEWATLYRMTGGFTYAFKLLAEQSLAASTSDLKAEIDASRTYTREEALDNAKKWLRPLIGFYHLTSEPEYLTDARKVADDYIAWRIVQEPQDYRDVGSSFWNELTPMYNSLFELYEMTGEAAYADAAVAAMREFAQYMQFGPVVPEGDITVDGETIPAWRVSEAGLVSESGGTSHSHRGIFMPYAAAFLARAAEYADDPFLRNIAKANIIGRYANYPGYTLRNQYSARVEKPDYPLQWYNTYSNTAHMNHPMPMALMIVDYLVSDVYDRSDRGISFPSRFTDTGAYFKNRVYGDQPGQFYGDSNVRLWLPKGLLMSDNVQANYIAGYGNGKLYVALSNASAEEQTVTLQLNPAIAAYEPSNSARLWKNNADQGTVTMQNGAVTVTIEGGGITALAIDGVEPAITFQDELDGQPNGALHAYSYSRTCEPFGTMTGSAMSLSPKLTYAHIYTDANPGTASSFTLTYSIDNGPPQKAVKSGFPFEFTVPLPNGASVLSYSLQDSEGRKSGQSQLWVSTDAPTIPAPAVDLNVCPMPEPEPEPEPAPPEVAFVDDFEDGLPNDWTVVKGKWTVETDNGSRVYRKTGGTAEGLLMAGNTSWTDYSVEARFKAYQNSGSGPASGITARVADAQNFYLFRLNWATETAQLMQNVGGKYATLKSYKLTGLSLQKWYTLRLEARGSTLIGYVDGVKAVEYTDAVSPPAGGIGVRTFNQDVAFDDVRVSVYDTPRSVPLYQDDFESGLDARWTFADGIWGIAAEDGSQVLKQTEANEEAIAYLEDETGWTDYSFEADIRYDNLTTILSSGLIAHYSDGNHFYLLRLFSDTSELQLLKKEDGAWSVLGSAPAEVTAGTWYRLRLDVQDDTLKAYLNGSPKFSVEDGTLPTGKIGLLAQHEQIAVDRIAVRALVTPAHLAIMPARPEVPAGDSVDLSASLAGASGEYSSVRWLSEDPAIAAVDANGTVAGLTPGTTVIRAIPTETDAWHPVHPASVSVTVSVYRQVDRTTPVTTAYASPVDGLNGWYMNSPTVKLSASDDLTGVQITLYRLNDGPWETYTQPVVISAEGITRMEYKSVDKAGNEEAVKPLVVKLDRTPPILNVALDKNAIWPPNHKLVTVTASVYAADSGSQIDSVVLTSIQSSEPDSGLQDGDEPGDIQGAEYGTFDTAFNLRAERSGNTGRVYTITYTASDQAGHKTIRAASVSIPHDLSGK